MKLEVIYPRRGLVEIEEIWTAVESLQPEAPFSEQLLNRCSRFSRFLFQDPEARRYPVLQALAFWMRDAAVRRMRDEFTLEQPKGTVRTGRGIIFHVPPSNVDTIFVYSWLLSMLCGNVNLLRVSRRASEQTEILLRAFEAAMGGERQDTWLLRYGHEEEITAAISERSDVRVIWGGDATVETIRKAKLPVHGRELTFPDRYSFSVLGVKAYQELSPEQRQELARNAYNDIYWFDQMACSSPHLLVWVGEPEAARQAGEIYFRTLGDVVGERGEAPGIGARLGKLTFACREAADGFVDYWIDLGAVTVLGSAAIDDHLRLRHGAGLLWQTTVAGLDELTPFVRRQDQTVSHFGLEEETLRQWVGKLGYRGVDRLVPIGKALQFDRIWDSSNLLCDFTRLVRVETSPLGGKQ